MIKKEYLTVDDVSKILSISRHTVYSWIYQGNIPYVKINNTYRFRKDKFHSWLKRRSYDPDTTSIQ